MKVKSTLAISLIFISGSSLARAAIDPCVNVTVSQQVFECSVHQKSKAETELNAEYAKLKKRVSSQYLPQKALGDAYFSTVQRAQRAWLKYREESCLIEAFELESGSEAHTTTVNNCVTKMNRTRTDELKSLLKE